MIDMNYTIEPEASKVDWASYINGTITGVLLMLIVGCLALRFAPMYTLSLVEFLYWLI